jgi:hypothetical protein
LINTDGLQEKVDAGVQKVDDKQNEVDNWWVVFLPSNKESFEHCQA